MSQLTEHSLPQRSLLDSRGNCETCGVILDVLCMQCRRQVCRACGCVCRSGSQSASSPTPVPTSGQPDRSISLLNQPPTSRVQAGLAIKDIAPDLDDVDDSIHQEDTSVNAARQPTEAFEEAALNALRTRKTCKRPASALDAKVMKAMPKGKAKAKRGPKCSAERTTTPPSLSM